MPHCLDRPARIVIRAENEKAVSEFAEKIMAQITEFAEAHSMDEMLILDPRIVDNWTECPRCESRICELQGHAYGMVIQKVMAFLKSEL